MERNDKTSDDIAKEQEMEEVFAANVIGTKKNLEKLIMGYSETIPNFKRLVADDILNDLRGGTHKDTNDRVYAIAKKYSDHKKFKF